MNQNRFLRLFIRIACLLCLAGCSMQPTYYSKQDVIRYVNNVFGADYELVDTLTYADDTDEANEIYEYLFSDGDTLEFSVFSQTDHVSFISGDTAFYEKKNRR